jgi:hypothetical protein
MTNSFEVPFLGTSFLLSEIDSREAGLLSPLHGEAEGSSEAFDHLQPIPLASTSTHNKRN